MVFYSALHWAAKAEAAAKRAEEIAKEAEEMGSGGGSDTFEAQLILDNVVNSGTLKTEEEVINETVAILKNVTGE